MMPASDPARIDAIVAELEPELIAMRRALHAHPELSWREHETQDRLRGWLEGRGIATRGCAGTGLIADISGGSPRVLYRGDIDALPIPETKATGCPYVSQNPGVSHACGHDVHATVAVGVALVLARLAMQGRGAVRVIL